MTTELKEAIFFLFTDWPSNSKLEDWPPFVSHNKGDTATIGQIGACVRKRIDAELDGSIDLDDRIYFGHLNRGVEIMVAGEAVEWEAIQGAIVDLGCAPPDSANDGLLRKMAKGLSRALLPYGVSKVGVLTCCIPATAQIPAALNQHGFFRRRRASNSEELTLFLAGWLVEMSQRIADDRSSVDSEVREQVNEYLEKCLLRYGKANYPR